ncbi:MAG TPA: hypothetical protein VJI68_02435 [Candidatus Nanoarchaeia archaeon]|nr:hypothetical protein [Candidatus Nanoarchaeia archaeon]
MGLKVLLIILVIVGVLFFFFHGFGTNIYEETKPYISNETNFEFTLNPLDEDYEVRIDTKVGYSCTISETLNLEIISPSGKIQTYSTQIGGKTFTNGRTKCLTGTTTTVPFKVKYEKGTFKVRVIKQEGQVPIEKITLKILKPWF